MEKETILDIFNPIKEKYPGLKEITIGFDGSGDEFCGYGYELGYDDKDKIVEISPDDVSSLYPICDYLVDELNISFDNDGAQGTVTFNFFLMQVSINSRYPVTEYTDGDSMTIELQQQ